jgi:hypothetical protein
MTTARSDSTVWAEGPGGTTRSGWDFSADGPQAGPSPIPRPGSSGQETHPLATLLRTAFRYCADNDEFIGDACLMAVPKERTKGLRLVEPATPSR